MKRSLKALLLSAGALASPMALVANDAYSQQDCCGLGNFTAQVDFLWWEHRNDDNSGFYESIDSSKKERKSLNDKNKFHPGVRLGVYMEDCDKCWDLGLIWTHLDTSSNRNINARDGYVFISNLDEDINLGQFSGRSRFSSELNYLDIDISKRLNLTDCFTFTPHVGFRALWLDYSHKIHGSGLYESFNRDFASHSKFDSTGYGIEGGFWAEWNVACDLSVYGHVGGSLLAYTTKIKSSNKYDQISLGSGENSYTREKRHTTSPIFNYSLGVQYAMCLCDYRVLFKAAWEQLHADNAYIQWQGLTLGANVAF